MAQIEVTEFRIKEQAWQPASGCVMASVVGMLPDEYFAGRAVEVKGTLEPASGPVAEGLFDYRKYLEEQGDTIDDMLPVRQEQLRIGKSPLRRPLRP